MKSIIHYTVNNEPEQTLEYNEELHKDEIKTIELVLSELGLEAILSDQPEHNKNTPTLTQLFRDQMKKNNVKIIRVEHKDD